MVKKLTQEEFIKRVYEVAGDEYSALSEYKGVDNKVLFRNNISGYEFLMTPYHFINRGQREGNNKGTRTASKTYNRRAANFDRKLENIFQGRYVRVDKYQGAKIKIKFYDKEKNEYFIVKPDNLIRGFNNPKYKPNRVKTPREFKEQVSELTDRDYSVIDDYKGAYVKLLFKNEVTGNTFKMTPHNFLRGQRDPNEVVPKGEREVIKALSKYNVKFIHQYLLPYEGARVNALRPDFYLPDYNAFIEFDGEQHYKPISMFGGEKAYKSQMRRDAIKNAYAFENGIKMVRIPYCYLGDIEKFLLPFLEVTE